MTTGGNKRAMVTGASRGIGKATAVALAAQGWDVAISARTKGAGEGRDDSDVGNNRPLPGSLDETAELVAAHGVRVLSVVADLHDHPTLVAAVDEVVGAWGGIDLLVNNAVDTGPGSMVPFVETSVEQLSAKLDANVVAQFILIQAVVPRMVEQGGGMVVNVTSHVATHEPPGPPGQGGWGMAYAASKAAFHRFAPLLAVELGDQGIRAYNLDPGNVATERMQVNAEALGLAGHYTGAPPEVPARVIAWLTEHPEAVENGGVAKAQKLALVHDLHPDWRPAR